MVLGSWHRNEVQVKTRLLKRPGMENPKYIRRELRSKGEGGGFAIGLAEISSHAFASYRGHVTEPKS